MAVKVRRGGVGKYTAQEIRSKYAEYLGHCDDVSMKPTWEGFAEFADVTSAALLGLMNLKGGDGSAAYPDMAEAMLKIQDSMVNRLLQRNDTMAVFTLKQPKYGGYTDKPVTGGETLKIEFTIRGMDSGERQISGGNE